MLISSLYTAIEMEREFVSGRWRGGDELAAGDKGVGSLKRNHSY